MDLRRLTHTLPGLIWAVAFLSPGKGWDRSCGPLGRRVSLLYPPFLSHFPLDC